MYVHLWGGDTLDDFGLWFGAHRTADQIPGIFAPRSDKLMEENENMREFQPWIWVKDQGCSII